MRPSPRCFLYFLVLFAVSFPGPLTAQPDTAALVLINEVDADQAGTDSAEFVELYDGGIGNLPLDDHVLVFYNGSSDTSYAAFDLDGLSTDANGYFVLCGNMATTPNCDLDVSPDTNLIQNGADAVALYFGEAASFPSGTAVTSVNIDDALVYDTGDADDPGLLVLLNAGQPQVDEGGGGNSTAHSNQRCPDGSGGALNTDTYEQWPPTPGAFNVCMEVIADPLINEFVANHTGTDGSEYVEIFGDVDVDYSAFTVLEVEGDSGGTGTIDEVIAVGTTDGAGFWDTGFLNNAIENGSVTLLLVETFSGMAGNDLDTDDDGNADAAPWSRIVDCVAVDDGGASDLTYCSTVLDSTLPPAGFTPGGASRIPDGTDTDTASDWVRNDFDGAGIPVLDPGTPEEGEAFNTPGASNALVPGEAPDIVINEIMQNPSAVADSAGEWFELHNAGKSAVDIDGWTIADAGIDTHLINNGGPLMIPAGGFLVLGNNVDSGTNGGAGVDYNYGSSFFLANGDDELILMTAAMVEVDRVEWDGGPNFPDPNGASMALIDPALDNNVGANWCTATTPFGAGDLGTPGSVNDCEGSPVQLLINEVDADTPGTDTAEFIEIYDGGAGNTPLDGLVLVLFNGSVDTSYGAFDLDGSSTDAEGYFVLCGDAANTSNCDLDVTPDSNLIQNGADAVALYMDSAASFPTGTAVTTTNLVDALVYDSNDSDDAGLLALLNAGQPQVNEGASNSAAESNQRCPNGTGGPRNTDSYEQWPPTPGAENVCAAVLEPPVCGDTESATLISAVQGSTDVSPLEGTVVEIEGVVVADLQGTDEYGGFFVQEEDVDADADPLTSEGIFVFTSEAASVGDRVRVRGTVDEFFNLTEISPASDVVICATGAAPPTPAMPTLPMSAPDEFEAIESMSIVMPQPLVINSTFTVFRFGELTVSSTRLMQPTSVVAPGAPANALAAANALDMLILDDRRTGQNLLPPVNGQDDTNPLAADNPIRSGQIVTGLSGVMHFAFDAWRVQPTAPFVIDEGGNLRTPAPAPVGGTLRVASFNVLNFFTTIDTGAPICGPLMNQGCRGADSAEEYARQLDKLVAAIDAIDADVLGLIELENNAGESLQALTDAVNAAAGAGTYDFIDTGTIGGDAIKVGFIYKPASVTPEGDFALLTSAVDARFDDSLNRPSLAQSFRATGNLALFTAIVNHLKSKGCGGASGDDEDQGDGQGCFNATRTSAAEALRDWANGDPTGTGTDSVLIIGDLNSYSMEDPIQALQTGDFTSLELAFEGPDAYTFVFDAQKGSLDYALSSAAMTPTVTGAATWNINADETVSLDYNTEFGVLPSFYAPTPYRSSDHDPIVVGLDLNPPRILTIPTLAAGVDATIEISGAGDNCGFSAAEFIDPGTLAPPPPDNLSFPFGVLSFTAERCSVGATATIEVTLPAIPDFLAWLKHLAGAWTVYPHSLAGNVFSIQVTDGGMGDADGAANGIIVDPSGPAVVAGGAERATFLVTKDFDDDNPAEVSVTLSCNTGLPLEQSAMIAEGEHVEFVIGDFEAGTLDCTVSEALPDGYAPSHSAGVGFAGVAGDVVSADGACSFIDVSNGQFICEITNTLQQVEITIFKEWIDDKPQFNLPQFVFIELSCSEAGFVGAQFITPADPGEFSVFPHFDGETCSVSEEPQVGVISDTGDCVGLFIEPGLDAECTVVNTRLFAGIPTLSRHGLLVLTLMMLMFGWIAVRRFA